MVANAALLFTDIVDSTLITQRLGDERAAALWTEHDRRARSLLREHKGREIGRSDGLLTLFGEAADAARYALDYHAQMAEELSRATGRNIVADTYRKWEAVGKKQNSLLPHDLIVPFCDLTKTHPFELLAAVPFRGAQPQPADRRRRATLRIV